MFVLTKVPWGCDMHNATVYQQLSKRLPKAVLFDFHGEPMQSTIMTMVDYSDPEESFTSAATCACQGHTSLMQ